MIVCQCKGITDRQIRALVHRGYDSVERIGRACGAGTECGGCCLTIAAVIQQERLLQQCEHAPHAIHPSLVSQRG